MKFKLMIMLGSLIFATMATAQAKDGMKIYISADMEGLVGAVTGQQLGPDGFEYSQFRKIYTNEVNAAIEAAFAAGATETLVSDSHGNGQRLLIEDLNPKGPITLEVSFKNYTPVELPAFLPMIELIYSHSIRYRGKNMIDISKFIEFILSYSVELKP